MISNSSGIRPLLQFLYTSRNPETIGRDPEKMEQEPAAQGEKYQYDEREGAGF